MTTRRSIIIACACIGAVSLSGCMTSPRPQDFPPALSERGAIGTVTIADGRSIRLELLVVRDSSMVVLNGRRLAVAYFRSNRQFAFGDFSSGWEGQSPWPSPKMIERGRAVSRFPFGIPEPTLKALLERAGQTAPDTLKP